MKSKLLLLIIILSIIMCGCGKGNHKGNNNRNNGEAIKPPEKAAVDPLKNQIEQMTVDEKVGQMVMIGLEGYEKDPYAQEMITKYKVGGFIFFKRNIKNAYQTLTLINSLKEANRENKIPLFFAVDEEGGRVTRMPAEFTKLPTSRAIGKINSEDFAFEVGSIIGQQLKSLGFNMNFAPVLDIDSNPNNPVIGDRSFGHNEEIVSKLGTATMKGIQSQVISAVKHFPGHGDTSTDSHISLPVVNHDMDRLKDFELVPFAQAIENGADMVMVAHILLPKIDQENPVTLSETVITDILREEMKFNGVIITDDMTMGAITENYDIGDAAVKSVRAGADIVLICHDNEKQVTVLEALKEAVADGVISQESLDEHVYRILKLKQKYNLNDEKIESVDVKGINEKIGEALSRYLK
ncbi:MAG TPA: beta-N-acetylhexosaminidase [Thermoanaerobacterales bacterium]|nr:beta-N-acetylhexosaminidase [Thermoanaerobacterales bacterium]